MALATCFVKRDWNHLCASMKTSWGSLMAYHSLPISIQSSSFVKHYNPGRWCILSLLHHIYVMTPILKGVYKFQGPYGFPKRIAHSSTFQSAAFKALKNILHSNVQTTILITSSQLVQPGMRDNLHRQTHRYRLCQCASVIYWHNISHIIQTVQVSACRLHQASPLSVLSIPPCRAVDRSTKWPDIIFLPGR